MDIRRKGEQYNAERSQGGSSAQAGGSRVVKTALFILVIAALVVAGFYFADNNASFSGPVAVVNGEEIPASELETQLEAFRNGTGDQAEQFNNLSERRQQEILLEGIINTRLQLQAAQDAGVTISDEQVETQLQEQVDQIGQDVFDQRLKDNDVTRQEVKDDLRNQMIINAHIQQQAGGQVSANEQEVQDLYSQYLTQVQQAGDSGTSTDAVAALEELRPQIEAAVIQQKQQQIATQILEQARENAVIEVFIEGVKYPASTNADANAQTQ
ncbi:MAG: SurA N-terminal domain-containing protein [Candidatus Paceibacterota bacterium]